ncbi:MAG: hypothetical protein HVN34_07585 [Methanobacteriaceae archaeon]|nr:hypothetical protein [Methanobacteriaceae archaeon]
MDNTPPDISGSVSPNPIKSGDALKIKVFSNIWYRYTPDDTANITATIFGKEFNIPLSSYSGGSMGKLEYTIPQVSDGVYSVFLTAEDMVGNSKTISVNYTVDNTPPIVNADINPNTTSSIDFSSNRGFKIIARSSSDTKAVYANYLGSDHLLYYSNDNWTLWVSLPPVMYLGTYVISLHAIDKAGNIGTTSSFFTVFDTTGITIHKDFEQNNGVNPGSSSQGGSGSGGSGSGGSGSGGSGSGGSGSGGSGSGGFNDYLPWILLAILIILLFVLLLLIFPILGTIIVELLVAVLDFLFFAELPGVLGLMFRLFFALLTLLVL